jgi:hypothetical protein
VFIVPACIIGLIWKNRIFIGRIGKIEYFIERIEYLSEESIYFIGRIEDLLAYYDSVVNPPCATAHSSPSHCVQSAHDSP